MSFASFGIGVNALAEGINSGLDAGQKIRTMRDQNAIRSTMADGLEKAKTQRQAEIDGAVKVGSKASADNTMTMPTYEVDGKEYGSEDQAKKVATDKVGTVMDYFYQNAAPQIADEYLKQGNMEKAEAWNTWIKDKNVQKGFKYGVKAFQAANMGQDNEAMDYLFKMYNQPGYFEDGRKAKSWAPIKDKSGDVTGYAITVQSDDGSTSVLNVNKGEEFLQQVQLLADPKSVYEMGWGNIQAANQAKVDLAKSNYKHSQALELEGVKAGNQQALQGVKTQGQMEVEGYKAWLQDAKPADIEKKAQGLQQIGTQMLGLQGEALKQFIQSGVLAKKDEDFVTMATNLLSKQQDWDGNNKFLTLPPDQQQAQIQQLAGTIKAAQSAQAPATLAGGVPSQPGAQPGSKPRAYKLDQKTGQMVPIP